MSDGIENQMSLADIAGLDVSDVEELRSSQIPAGLFVFEVTKTGLDETTVGDDEELRYKAAIELKVVGVETIVEKGVEESDVMNKTHTETFFINPAEAQKGIGFLKGFITDIGGDSTGNIGGVEDGPEGFLDRIVGHRFTAKIIKKKARDGNFYSRLQLLKVKKAA